MTTPLGRISGLERTERDREREEFVEIQSGLSRVCRMIGNWLDMPFGKLAELKSLEVYNSRWAALLNQVHEEMLNEMESKREQFDAIEDFLRPPP